MSCPLSEAILRGERKCCASLIVHSAIRRVCACYVPRTAALWDLCSPSSCRRKKSESPSPSASVVVINHHLTHPILELFSYYAVNGEIAVSARL